MDTVNKDGLLEGYTALDQFKPLSETILHELMHVVGGSKSTTYVFRANTQSKACFTN